ncbi:MAG: CoA-binding domain protein, partial [Gemmatimonadetes bacterium]|nr:CoA-binding domain protein [Gemmatimonadota bacterium]
MGNPSLSAILRPQSIAVVGASRTPGTIGYNLVANLLQARFTGPVYPVNPKAASICSVPVFPDLASIPGPVDQAIVVVPKEHVLSVAR